MGLVRSMSNPPENVWYQILERNEPLCEFSCWGGMSNYTLYVWEEGGEKVYRVPPQRGDLPLIRSGGQRGVRACFDQLSGITFFRNSWGRLLKTAIIKI